MSFFDKVIEMIDNSEERKAFLNSFPTELTQKQFDDIVSKVTPTTQTSEQNLVAFRNALPKEYVPDATILNSQREVQPKLMRLIAGTEVELKYSPIRTAIQKINISQSRAVEAFGAYVDAYGSAETKAALYEIINEKPFDPVKFKTEFLKRAPHEVELAAAHMVELRRKMAMANTPTQQMDIYNEVRICGAMAGESVNFLSAFSSVIPADKRAELDQQFGTVYQSTYAFTLQVNALAHPLANYVDYNALKKVPENKLREIVSNFLQNPLDEFQSKDEIVVFSNIVNSRRDDHNVWCTEIRNQVGEPDQRILYRKEDGTTGILDQDALETLYAEGKPFYAIPINAAGNKEPVLCQPSFGHKLMTAEDVKRPVTVRELAEPEYPGVLASMWDSIISVIGGVFGQNWRVNSVLKYEQDLERYNDSIRMRAAAKESADRYSQLINPETLASAKNDLANKAAEIKEADLKADADKEGMSLEEFKEKRAREEAEAKARAQAKAEAEEKERLEKEAKDKAIADKKEEFKDLGLQDKDLDFLAKHAVALDEFAAGMKQKDKYTVSDLAGAFVVHTARVNIYNAVKRIKESGAKDLGPAFAKARRYDKNPVRYFRTATNELATDDLFEEMAEGLSQDKLKVMCKTPADARTATEVANFVLAYEHNKLHPEDAMKSKVVETEIQLNKKSNDAPALNSNT